MPLGWSQEGQGHQGQQEELGDNSEPHGGQGWMWEVPGWWVEGCQLTSHWQGLWHGAAHYLAGC